MIHPQGMIHALRDFVRGPTRMDYERHGREVQQRVGQGEPDLRRAAFERGEEPLPGAGSWPPPRRTGWEDDLW